MTKKTAQHVLKIKASELAILMNAVLPFVDKTTYLPILDAVLVRSDGKYVTATATDRYRLGVRRMKVDSAPKGLSAVISAQSAKSMMAVFKATRNADIDLTLTFTEGQVNVTAASTLNLIDASMTWPLVAGEYPKTDKLLTDAFSRTPVTENAGSVAVNPTYLGQFKHIQQHEALRMSVNGPAQPILVQIGEDFVGLLMAMRHSEGLRQGLDGEWLTLLGSTQTAKAVAS